MSDMDFISNNKLQTPLPMDQAGVVSAKPFPFFRLPREIRDSVYVYALMHAKSKYGPSGTKFMISTRVWHMHLGHDLRQDSHSSFKMTNPTRLFCISRQFSSEASDVFYSTFTFVLRFCKIKDSETYTNALEKSLPLQAQRSIRKLEMNIDVSCIFGCIFEFIPLQFRKGRPTLSSAEIEKRRQCSEAVVKGLPNVRYLRMTLKINSLPKEDQHLAIVVDPITNVMNPLRQVPHLTIRKGYGKETSQTLRVLKEVRESLGCA